MQNYSAKIMKTGKTLIIPGTHNNTSLTNEKCFPVYFFMHDIISIKKTQKKTSLCMFQLKQFPTLSYSLVLAN